MAICQLTHQRTNALITMVQDRVQQVSNGAAKVGGFAFDGEHHNNCPDSAVNALNLQQVADRATQA